MSQDKKLHSFSPSSHSISTHRRADSHSHNISNPTLATGTGSIDIPVCCRTDNCAADKARMRQLVREAEEKWFVVLFSRVGADNERTSIKVLPSIAEFLVIAPSSPSPPSSVIGWDLVCVIGPLNTTELAESISNKWASSQKGIIAKVARGEALSKTMGLTGYVDWGKVFDCPVLHETKTVHHPR